MSRALLKLQLSDMGDSAAGFGGAKPKAKITKMKRKRGREVLICGCMSSSHAVPQMLTLSLRLRSSESGICRRDRLPGAMPRWTL